MSDNNAPEGSSEGTVFGLKGGSWLCLRFLLSTGAWLGASCVLHLQRPQWAGCELHFDWMDESLCVFKCVWFLSVSTAKMMHDRDGDIETASLPPSECQTTLHVTWKPEKLASPAGDCDQV